MSFTRSELAEVINIDRRFPVEAYEFLMHALSHTQEMLGKAPDAPSVEDESEIRHVTGPQLMEGVRDLACDQFGMMAPAVFRLWGIRETADFGTMVYRLIDAGVWRRSSSDRVEDFDDCFDFQQAFVDEFTFKWDDF